MRGSSAFEKNYHEKQVKSSAGATCPNEQQLGRLQICTGFLAVIVSQAHYAARRNTAACLIWRETLNNYNLINKEVWCNISDFLIKVKKE